MGPEDQCGRRVAFKLPEWLVSCNELIELNNRKLKLVHAGVSRAEPASPQIPLKSLPKSPVLA